MINWYKKVLELFRIKKKGDYMAALLTTIGLVVTAIIGYVGQFADIVTDKPVFAIGLTGLIIGLTKSCLRLFKRW